MEISGGGYSSVLVAQDISTCKNVVLKVGVAGNSLRETEIYPKLCGLGSSIDVGVKYGASNPGDAPIVKCLDEFKHAAMPDEIYYCLVFEPMATCLRELVLAFHPPLRVVKHILKDVLRGLEYLHSYGYLHGDLHDGNVLVSSCDMSTVPVDVDAMGILRLDEGSKLQAKLADLGSAYPLDDPPVHALGPCQCKSPEDLLSTDGSPSLDQKIDI
ncbi:kinase-like protein [Melanomma pulvis-pyrius CBS 109.77]|uniref:non-specific serine/threonine protein kinase n=1 Tax=Melanomma pulvis-pyrius CBS 109.77 TaxID=1314802 RepID=A0A6A6XWC2_9PLEO|nr:kinase-like protein [Melanomma pulvis-pyrius CBS 109.77]